MTTATTTTTHLLYDGDHDTVELTNDDLWVVLRQPPDTVHAVTLDVPERTTSHVLLCLNTTLLDQPPTIKNTKLFIKRA